MALRYGIVSDIHGNVPALMRVLSYLEEESIDKYLCCGDIVGYGAQPNECLKRLRALDTISVQGNHDEAVWRPEKERWFTPAARACIRWTREQMTQDNIDYLENLPFDTRINGIHLCHGSLHDPDTYVYEAQTAIKTFDVMESNLCFFGHTHCAGWFIQKSPGGFPTRYTHPGAAKLTLESDNRYMVNPGAVGQPRDGNSQAACAVYDTEESSIHIKRLGYDIEAAQQAIVDAGLPEEMARRLSIGV